MIEMESVHELARGCGILLSQKCAGGCLTKLTLWKVEWGLVYSICLFVWDKCSQHSQLQITSMMTVQGWGRMLSGTLLYSISTMRIQ